MRIRDNQRISVESTRLELALMAWRSAIGVDHVDTKEGNLQIAGTATFALERNVSAILHPLNQKEVMACVQIAGQFGQSIYPVSRGLNWGFGSKVPGRDAGIILDLSRMNRVLEYNEELAYVRIEPGVTHGMLYDFLQSRQSELWVAPTGAGPDTSVIGNALERGHGVTPYGDNVSQISDLEVVLADGKVIRTGFGMYGNHRLSPIDRWGVGPSLDGLFSQSSLGIVTSVTLWLMPKPQASSMGYLTFSTTESFLDAMVKLRPLKLQEAIRGGIVATNDWRMYHSEPSLMGPEYNHPMENCYQDFMFNKWNIVFGLYGTPMAISETQETIKRQIENSDSLCFFDDAPGENITYPNEYCHAMHSIFSGVPGQCPSRMYFPKGEAPDVGVQPEVDQCGIIWLTACSPFLKKDLSIAASIIEETFEGSGFVPDINIFCKRPRSLHYHIAMFYDRSTGDDDRAMQCYRKLECRFFEAGYLPHRLGVQYEDVRLKQLDRVGALISSLKSTLDPQSVIGSGKYD